MATTQRSNRGLLARRLIREDLAQELFVLYELGRNVPVSPMGMGLVGSPGDGTPITPFNLPRDTMQDIHVPRNFESCVDDPKYYEKLHICIIGAGVAGLYTAMILDSLKIPNLTYDILEASERIGGRIYTHYFQPKEPHQYYDIGAMRYPRLTIMDRVFKLFKTVGIEDKLITYFMGSDDGVVNVPKYFNDRHADPDDKIDPFKVSTLNGAIQDALEADWEKGFQELMKYDRYSTREYIREFSNYKDFATIQWLETTGGSASGLYDQAFVESVIDSFDFDVPKPEDPNVSAWACLDGGSRVLIDGMLKQLKTQPTTAKRVSKIAINHKAEEKSRTMIVRVAGEDEDRAYSTVFNTTTLAAAQRMDLKDAELHPVVKDAIRSLRYDASCKVAIKFSSPWWIKKGITRGGSAATDRPIRTCVYPSYNVNDPLNESAILLCSYTWAQDAQRIGGLIGPDGKGTDNQLKELILQDLALLHSQTTTLQELQDGFEEMHAYDWYADPHAGGAFALFGPGQFTNLYPIISRPTADGNLHFIGEATSSHHAWVIGALNSAWRGVHHMLLKYQREDTSSELSGCQWGFKIKQLETKWGIPDEIDPSPEGTAHLQALLGCLSPEEQVQVDIGACLCKDHELPTPVAVAETIAHRPKN